jgi:hypothetical protein
MYIMRYLTNLCDKSIRLIEEKDKHQIINNLIEKFIDTNLLKQRKLL